MRLNVVWKAVGRHFRKKKIWILCVLLIVVLIYHFHKPDNRLQKWYKENLIFLDSRNNSECKIPEYDIFDPTITEFISVPPVPINCGKPQPYLTYMDWNGVLYLNNTEVANYNYEDIRCIYQTVSLNKDDDYKVEFGPTIGIVFPLNVTAPSIKVECYSGIFSVYKMIHTQIGSWKPEKVKINKSIPKHRPSVLVFGIDSMSRGNFIRTLPLTYKFLVEELGITVFKGLNKVADNTFPNMAALLAGISPYRRDFKVPLWTYELNSTIKGYDELPIVWKQLREQGYVTMYCEEYIDTIFSYMDVGFKKDPVDYYYRAPYAALKKLLSNKLAFWDRSKRLYCLGNEPTYKYMLNYTEEFLVEMTDLRYFALSFFVEMSHEYLTDVANMDVPLSQFFRRMFGGGYLNNTVVLVMGDHGHRYDKIRATYIGRLEERMPFLGIILPESFKRAYPHLQKSLESHTNRLLSWFDIHQTLMDIVDDDLEKEQTKHRPGFIGKSIFRKFGDVRTCTEIGILPEYCICDREANIPVTLDKAVLSADVAIKHINTLLIDSHKYLHKDESRHCAHLSIKNITLASVSMRSYIIETFSVLIRVIFYVWPSHGMFEAAVEHKLGTEPTVLGDINRINKYGDQPNCIAHDILRLYCFCTP